MRIVGGEFGGRVLRAPVGANTRPTSEKVREALFNILGNRIDVEGAHVLDVCAGSGALGLEAVSRGAEHVIFLESARAAVDTIRANIADFGCAARCEIHQGDATSLVKKLTPKAPWRIVFVDPPYKTDVAVRAVTGIPLAHLTDDAIVLIEHDNRNVPPDAVGSLVRTDQRRYGDTSVSFYQKDKP